MQFLDGLVRDHQVHRTSDRKVDKAHLRRFVIEIGSHNLGGQEFLQSAVSNWRKPVVEFSLGPRASEPG